MKYSDDTRLVMIDPLLRRLQREYDDALWSETEDYDYYVAEREITRLKEAQQKGDVYDPVF